MLNFVRNRCVKALKFSRASSQVEIDRGRMVWKVIERPSVVYAAEVCWLGGRSSCRKLESTNMRVGRIFLGEAIQ